ncbi:acetate kinase [Mucilaginibacter terrenus]|uniref:Acetate kinase n=1 Tax=Mucilaginibacter terrenus TaxID=2482727 RepID=A0A3E2NL06_9SPHI|nr:acetate kinase [Mucilaginibacter terrenus]RFZ81668.1 acetate kinase [Mucilaginibacter terrenus]
MNIFVINSGSSSIKYQLFIQGSATPLCSGLVERIGHSDAQITHKYHRNNKEDVIRIEQPIADHEAGMLAVAELLTRADIAVVQSAEDINVVGHRIVHGGETLTHTTVITPEVKDRIQALFPMAPLHNPGHYEGIKVAEKTFPEATQVAVFDTAFHQTLPEKAFRYAIPNTLYHELGIRVYGFHGISHQYVSREAAHYLSKPDAKVITIHLGNGCSMAAVNAGRCIDTSMGLTPLDGLIMGTRSGSIDASVLLYLTEQNNYTTEQLKNLLNKQSGMLGLTGHNDMRDISALYRQGIVEAKLAYDMYAYRIKKFIGAYAAVLNGLDAIVFTAGVGENDALARELVCRDMEYLGIGIDIAKNELRESGIRDITAFQAKTRVLVIPTNEELEIARQCQDLLMGA